MHEPPDTTSALFTIPQVATYLGICRAHVYTLIQSGLPTIKLGRLVRIHKQTLDAWLKDQEHPTHLM
jgi:excisionase family DNA binding protein